LMALFLSMLSILAFPWLLRRALEAHLGHDSRAGEFTFDQEKATSLSLQVKLDSINREHGNAYIEGIQPGFDILNLKAGHFDSSWNWVRQDALLMYYDIIFWTAYYHRRSRNHRALHCPP
jgi:3-oxoacyl-ACP reductase-like protein